MRAGADSATLCVTSAGERSRASILEFPAADPGGEAEELLSLNIEDLDLEFRRGRVTSKGGATEYVHWATGTARLRKSFRCRASG